MLEKEVGTKVKNRLEFLRLVEPEASLPDLKFQENGLDCAPLADITGRDVLTNPHIR